ncbi:hypothetical protein DFH06DRAFT_54250 [Mycena polygramma]|nr:hypothetical protein DFH06DRAFT_54250 [Mycena polygramma]
MPEARAPARIDKGKGQACAPVDDEVMEVAREDTDTNVCGISARRAPSRPLRPWLPPPSRLAHRGVSLADRPPPSATNRRRCRRASGPRASTVEASPTLPQADDLEDEGHPVCPRNPICLRRTAAPARSGSPRPRSSPPNILHVSTSPDVRAAHRRSRCSHDIQAPYARGDVTPKRFVHLVGPPLNQALDAYATEGRGRWLTQCGGAGKDGGREGDRRRRKREPERNGDAGTRLGIFVTRAASGRGNCRRMGVGRCEGRASCGRCRYVFLFICLLVSSLFLGLPFLPCFPLEDN